MVNPQIEQPTQQPTKPTTNQRQAVTYTVKPGDSWWSIANARGLNMYAIAAINGRSINSTIYPGQLLKLTAGNTTSHRVTPAKSNSSNSWTDSLGDTWHSERGTFISNSWINLRWGAKTNSSRIGTITPGQTVKYDAWSRHDGYVWVRQPRANGNYGYLAVRDSNGTAFGYFK